MNRARAWAVRIRTSRARRSQLAVGQALLAELDHVGAAGQGLADDPGQVAERRQAADQDHQPGVAQRRGTSWTAVSVELLERVDVVAQDLEPAGEPDVDELAVLLQRSAGPRRSA